MYYLCVRLASADPLCLGEQEAEMASIQIEGAKYGVSFGSALAMAVSFGTNHSLLWAIIDGLLGWIYVIYFALAHA